MESRSNLPRSIFYVFGLDPRFFICDFGAVPVRAGHMSKESYKVGRVDLDSATDSSRWYREEEQSCFTILKTDHYLIVVSFV